MCNLRLWFTDGSGANASNKLQYYTRLTKQHKLEPSFCFSYINLVLNGQNNKTEEENQPSTTEKEEKKPTQIIQP